MFSMNVGVSRHVYRRLFVLNLYNAPNDKKQERHLCCRPSSAKVPSAAKNERKDSGQISDRLGEQCSLASWSFAEDKHYKL